MLPWVIKRPRSISMTLTSTSIALGQFMGFEQVAKFHQGGGIGHAGAAQINAHEVAQSS